MARYNYIGNPPTMNGIDTTYLIDIGPFYDRFGAQKMAVLTSTDPVIIAIRADVSIRKWIDLERPDVLQSVQYIASVIPAVGPLISHIMYTPVSEEDNLALRKLYFT